LWSELVQPFESKEGWLELKTAGETADYKTYPRLCALAEQGWTPQAARDFGKFSERLGEHYGRLKEAGIMFRVPPVAMVVHGTTIEIIPPFHDAHVRYTLDGSEPLAAGKDWDGKPLTGDSKLFRARTIFEGRPSALCVAPEKAKAKM
jgi:hexosaminidase